MGSSSPQIMSEEDPDISPPAPSPAPVEVPALRETRRPRKVQGDDDSPDIILFVGKAEPTSVRCLPVAHLAHSQHILLTYTLRMYRDITGWWVCIRTSQREISMKVKKCLDKWIMNNRSQPTDMALCADTACEYCRATSHKCARR